MAAMQAIEAPQGDDAATMRIAKIGGSA